MAKKAARKPSSRENPAYALPAFLQGTVTHADYVKWLNQKCDSMRQRDLELKRPWAGENSRMAYKQKIHDAVIDSGSDALEFEICSWVVNEAKSCMDPDEFVGLCKKVVDYRLTGGGKSLSEP